MWADKCLRQQCSVFLQDRDSGQSPVELRLRIDKPFSLHLQIFDIDQMEGMQDREVSQARLMKQSNTWRVRFDFGTDCCAR